MLIEVTQEQRSPAMLKVLGLGGAGGNAVNRMIASEIRGVEFLVANTDAQALHASACPHRIQIGEEVTGGLGSGGDPALGRRSAEEDADLLRDHLKGADMVFIAAGMGGGTGTGASPIVAQLARELGALTVGIVTRPFTFEGRRRMRQAEEGLEELREAVDTLIVIPNQRLLHVVDRSTPLNEALRVADDVLCHATKGISEIITVPGLINVDFADVRSVMAGMGNALMGMGFGQGPDRARMAADMAISSPLLEDVSIAGAQALLVNFMGGEDMTLTEVDEASNLILESAGPDANVIFGSVVDPAMKDEIRVTLIATGFGDRARAVAPREARDAGETEARTVAVRGEPAFAPGPAPAAPIPSVAEREYREAPPEPAPVVGSAEPQRMVAAGGSRAASLPEGEPVWNRAPERSPFDLGDGVVGPARPIGRQSAEMSAQLEPAREGAVAVAERPAPVHDDAPFSEDEQTGGVRTEEISEPEIVFPTNVVPLVCKQNLRGQRWAPRMSNRWQRVLRRDQFDVPSFLRRRQRD